MTFCLEEVVWNSTYVIHLHLTSTIFTGQRWRKLPTAAWLLMFMPLFVYSRCSAKSSWWHLRSQSHVKHWVWFVLRCNRCTVHCVFFSTDTWPNDIQYSTTWSSVEHSKGRPRSLVADLHGPLQILFSSHISVGVIFTGEQTWVCCHSCPWHRTSAHSHLKAVF